MRNCQLSFVVFILNKFALATGIPISDVYKRFEVSGILDNYLIKHYEVLHTLGENYLIEDLTEMLAQKSAQ